MDNKPIEFGLQKYALLHLN